MEETVSFFDNSCYEKLDQEKSYDSGSESATSNVFFKNLKNTLCSFWNAAPLLPTQFFGNTIGRTCFITDLKNKISSLLFSTKTKTESIALNNPKDFTDSEKAIKIDSNIKTKHQSYIDNRNKGENFLNSLNTEGYLKETKTFTDLLKNKTKIKSDIKNLGDKNKIHKIYENFKENTYISRIDDIKDLCILEDDETNSKNIKQLLECYSKKNYFSNIKTDFKKNNYDSLDSEKKEEKLNEFKEKLNEFKKNLNENKEYNEECKGKIIKHISKFQKLFKKNKITAKNNKITAKNNLKIISYIKKEVEKNFKKQTTKTLKYFFSKFEDNNISEKEKKEKEIKDKLETLKEVSSKEFKTEFNYFEKKKEEKTSLQKKAKSYREKIESYCEKREAYSSKASSNDKKLKKMMDKIKKMNERLKKIDEKIDEIDKKLNKTDKKLNKIDKEKFNNLKELKESLYELNTSLSTKNEIEIEKLRSDLKIEEKFLNGIFKDEFKLEYANGIFYDKENGLAFHVKTSDEGELSLNFYGIGVEQNFPVDLIDVQTNESITQFFGGVPSSYVKADKIVKRLKELYGDKLKLYGISMGGGIAQYAALLNNVEAVCYNASLLGPGLLAKVQASIDAGNDKKIIHFSTHGDWLSHTLGLPSRTVKFNKNFTQKLYRVFDGFLASCGFKTRANIGYHIVIKKDQDEENDSIETGLDRHEDVR